MKISDRKRSKALQKTLMWSIDNVGMPFPNYTPYGWFENDVLLITDSGYVVEYEVKVSRGDFKKDLKKAHRGEKKFDLIAKGDCFPHRFYYVTPRGLIKPEELPPNTGWITFEEWTKDDVVRFYDRNMEVRCPLLHREDRDIDNLKHQIFKTGYDRYLHQKMSN